MGGEGDERGWDGWMASPTQRTWVWVNSGTWWWTGRPGVLRSVGSQRVRHDWVTELDWTDILTSNAKEAEVEQFYEDLKPSRTNNQKRCPFHYSRLECKSRKSRNSWSNRQIWPWSAEWSRAKTNSVLPRECTGHSKHPLPTTQEKTLHMDITRWSTLKTD